MARPGLLLYFDIIPALDKLPREAVGELLLSALHYAQDGVEPSFDDAALGFAWAFLKPAIDRDGAAYQDKQLRGDWLVYCRKCKREGIDALDFETWRERVDNDTLRAVDAALPTTTTTHLQPNYNSNTSSTPTQNQLQHNIGADNPPTHSRFVPPTVEEVRSYCLERGNEIDPEVFVSFYASKGWAIGKNKMKDWRAAIRTWESKRKEDHHDQHTGDTGKGSGRWNITPDLYG